MSQCAPPSVVSAPAPRPRQHGSYDAGANTGGMRLQPQADHPTAARKPGAPLLSARRPPESQVRGWQPGRGREGPVGRPMIPLTCGWPPVPVRPSTEHKRHGRQGSAPSGAGRAASLATPTASRASRSCAVARTPSSPPPPRPRPASGPSAPSATSRALREQVSGPLEMVAPAQGAAPTRALTRMTRGVMSLAASVETCSGPARNRLFTRRSARARRAHIAVLDTGVDQGHPELAGAIDACLRAGHSAKDLPRHGTHVSGIIAALADNAAAIAGVADCRRHVWKVFRHPNRSGACIRTRLQRTAERARPYGPGRSAAPRPRPGRRGRSAVIG